MKLETNELPRDTEAELDVLATIFDDPQQRIHLIADRLRPEHFFAKINEIIYRCALALSDAGQDVGITNAQMWLADRGLLKAGGGQMEGGATVEKVLLGDVHFRMAGLKLEAAATRIREKHAAREAIALGHKLVLAATGDVGSVVDFLEAAADSFVAIRKGLTDGATTKDVHTLYELVDDYDGSLERGERRDYVTTGCKDLDDDLGGWEYGDVAVFGAQTNWGKSNFAVMMVEEAIKAGKRPLLITFEDKPRLYLRRFLARHLSLSAYELKHLSLKDEARRALRQFRDTTKEAAQLPFIVNGRGKPIETVCARVRRICQLAEYDLLVWDHAHAMKTRERFKETRDRLAHVTREVTDCTKDVEAAGLLLSQFKRLKDGEEPTIYDLKESGDIENGAESVLLGYNDEDGAPRVRLGKSKDSMKNIDYAVSWDPRTASMRLSGRIADTKKPKAA